MPKEEEEEEEEETSIPCIPDTELFVSTARLLSDGMVMKEDADFDFDDGHDDVDESEWSCWYLRYAFSLQSLRSSSKSGIGC